MKTAQEALKAADVKVDRLFWFSGEGTLLALADVTLLGIVGLRGLRVVRGMKGLFVSMPRNQGKDGKWRDVIAPHSDADKDTLARVVLEAYTTKRRKEGG